MALVSKLRTREVTGVPPYTSSQFHASTVNITGGNPASELLVEWIDVAQDKDR